MRVADRVVTIAIPGAAASGVQSFDVQIPDNVDLIIEAWSSLGVPAVLFEGTVGLADAQARLAAAPGVLDCLMAIPSSGGPVRRKAGPPLNKLTLFWESTEGSAPGNVTIRILADQPPEHVAREARVA